MKEINENEEKGEPKLKPSEKKDNQIPFKTGKEEEEKENDSRLIAKKKQTLKDGILALVANEFY